MKVPFVNLGAQHTVIKDELELAFQRIYDKTAFMMGPSLAEFEESYAAFCGVSHAIGVANGTDSLTLALKALGVGPGDKVITAANTFIATVEAIVHAGATPVLVDVDSKTYNIDTAALKELLESDSQLAEEAKAIIPVHLYGQPANMDGLMAIANEYELIVLEDACQAHGAEYKGRVAGSMGRAGCFSFYPAKNLGAYGDGGLVITDDEHVATTLRMLRDHGSRQKYYHDMIGYNSRLDALQAAVLSTKLLYLDEWNARRRENAALYDDLLSRVDGVVPPGPGVLEGVTPVYHLYVVYLERRVRDELAAFLKEQGVGVGIHYPIPVHLTEAFKSLGYAENSFPVTEDRAGRILSLPMFPELSQDQIEYVVEQVAIFLAG